MKPIRIKYFYVDGIAFKDSATGALASAATKVRAPWCSSCPCCSCPPCYALGPDAHADFSLVQAWIEQKVMSRAVSWFNTALHVVPMKSPLKLSSKWCHKCLFTSRDNKCQSRTSKGRYRVDVCPVLYKGKISMVECDPDKLGTSKTSSIQVFPY